MSKHKCAQCGKQTEFPDRRCKTCYNEKISTSRVKCTYCGHLFTLDQIVYVEGLAVCETDREQVEQLLKK